MIGDASLSEQLFRYAAWALIMALGAGIALVEERLWHRFWLWILLLCLAAGGVVTTRLSPFTFSGNDYYMEGVIATAAGGLLLVGYVGAAGSILARRLMTRGKP
jgi:hypothetical protein